MFITVVPVTEKLSTNVCICEQSNVVPVAPVSGNSTVIPSSPFINNGNPGQQQFFWLSDLLILSISIHW